MNEQEIVNWTDNHLRTYRETDGAEGHIVDLSVWGGRKATTTLLLRTIGRKSGRVLINPLIYLAVGGEYVIVASKGGAPDHPAWYLNLTADPEVRFQVGQDHFKGSWRIIQGAERPAIWDALVDHFPRYTDYQASTDREIPVIALKPTETIPSLEE